MARLGQSPRFAVTRASSTYWRAPSFAQSVSVVAAGWRPITAVNSRAVWFPLLSLGGGDLLVEGVGVGLLVLDAVEVLAVDVGERGAVAGGAEEQGEHRPDA